MQKPILLEIWRLKIEYLQDLFKKFQVYHTYSPEILGCHYKYKSPRAREHFIYPQIRYILYKSTVSYSTHINYESERSILHARTLIFILGGFAGIHEISYYYYYYHFYYYCENIIFVILIFLNFSYCANIYQYINIQFYFFLLQLFWSILLSCMKI